ncbi:MAG: flagellar M-ring protein FliF [Polyangiales bacterium]|jgi:flagellar M-ring protein FliF
MADEEAPPETADWKAQLQYWKERALSASPMAKVIGLTLAGVAIAGVMLFGAGGSTDYETLYSSLSADDSSRIIERLGRMGIPFEVEENTILVAGNQVHDARMTLASEGLPSGGGQGFELFDEQRFGESEFTEQVQYHRALEGELSRTIGHLAGVERARVHLVLPERSLFVERDGNASASIVLHLAPGWRVSEAQSAGIIHLVASSVRGLDPDSVTLVDGEGRPVGEGGEDEFSDSIAYRQRLERDRERSLQSLLDSTLGTGIARVEVSAEVSFRREERTEERYLPEESVARSFQIEEERDATDAQTAEGIPGAASNLPGGEPNEAGTETAGLRRRSETRNFEVSKTVRHAVEPVGQLVRQSIAVVVDGTWEGETFTPRSDEEIARITEIAQSAAGINAERGDSLTVTCVPFSRTETGPTDPLEAIRPYEPYFPYLGWLLGLLCIPVALFFIRRWIRAMREAKKEEAKAKMAKSDPDSLQLLDPKEITPGSVREMLLGSGDESEALLASEVQSIAAELAAEDPLRAARIIRAWINADAAADKNDKKKEGAAA